MKKGEPTMIGDNTNNEPEKRRKTSLGRESGGEGGRTGDNLAAEPRAKIYLAPLLSILLDVLIPPADRPSSS